MTNVESETAVVPLRLTADQQRAFVAVQLRDQRADAVHDGEPAIAADHADRLHGVARTPDRDGLGQLLHLAGDQALQCFKTLNLQRIVRHQAA